MRRLRRPLVWNVVGLAAIELLVCCLYRGPRPIPDEPVNEQLPADNSQSFSAERAVSIHEELFPPKPHPAGSVENLLVRDRLMELLRQRHWEVEVQTSVVESDAKVVVHNVLAKHPDLAKLTARPLVLATHYDSCRTGPGAGDAGGCVAAVIEAARGLVATDTSFGASFERPVYLLFTDGEELGLLGAQQFVKRHPLSAQKPIVLNFDARGTSGPVLMYETHAGNRAAVAAWSNELARPRITGSLFTAVYRTMPNASDFTVFQNAGWQGFNFAIIEGAHRYHQPDDTLANLDRRSLQHFGEHALRLARVIATASDELPKSPQDAAFFDVLGLFVVHYPLTWCLPLSLAVLVSTLVVNRRSLLVPAGPRMLLRVGVVGLMVAVASLLLGWFLSRLLRDVGLLPSSFVWYGHGLSVALWVVSAAISLGISHWLLHRRAADVVWSAVWVWWAVAGVSSALVAPEFNHLLLWPGFVAAATTMRPWSIAAKTVVATLSSAVLLVPILHLLSIAMGPSAGELLCPAFALALMPLYPVLATSDAESRPNDSFRPTHG